MGCGTVVFILNMSRLGCIPTEREGERERVRGGRSVVLHPLLSRESHHETPKHKELRACDWNQGTFYPEAGATLGQERHPAHHEEYCTSSPSTVWPACLHLKKENKGTVFHYYTLIQWSKWKTVKQFNLHPRHTHTHTHWHLTLYES